MISEVSCFNCKEIFYEDNIIISMTDEHICQKCLYNPQRKIKKNNNSTTTSNCNKSIITFIIKIITQKFTN